MGLEVEQTQIFTNPDLSKEEQDEAKAYLAKVIVGKIQQHKGEIRDKLDNVFKNVCGEEWWSKIEKQIADAQHIQNSDKFKSEIISILTNVVIAFDPEGPIRNEVEKIVEIRISKSV